MSQAPLPQGLKFLATAERHIEECNRQTKANIPKMGNAAPACQKALAELFGALDAAASCLWKCNEGDHLLQYLLGRVASSALASYRLLLGGFYDESLALTRNIGEVANLLLLFSVDQSALTEWRNATRRARLRDFGPRAVRDRLSVFSAAQVGIEDDRYRALCELGVHATPDTVPQRHNPIGRPTLGGYLQHGGVIVALNELALATGLAAASGAILLGKSEPIAQPLAERALRCISAIGSLTILNVDAAFEKVAEDRTEPNRAT